jgi:hypothetical protein
MVKSRKSGKSADSVSRNILRIIWSVSIENRTTFPIQELRKNSEKQEVL